jgi:FlaG/FlaF family flagellin (archaellin)
VIDDPQESQVRARRNTIAVIVMTVVVVVFAGLVAFFMYGVQGIGS